MDYNFGLYVFASCVGSLRVMWCALTISIGLYDYKNRSIIGEIDLTCKSKNRTYLLDILF